MQAQPHILVVDDDREIRTLLGRYLDGQGFRVSVAADRRESEQKLGSGQFDLIVLDVMLPDGSGLDICRALRDRKPHIPVILLTALKEDVDRIIGLELGADDDLGKPFNPRELAARIRAVLRRSAPEEAPPRVRVYQFAGYRLEPDTRKVMDAEGALIDLTGAEFDLLQVFLDRPGRLLSRDQLLDLTQGRERDPLDRSVDVLMSRLRRKFGDAGEGPLFKTVRNGGYQLTARVETAEAEA
ncbi:response regulator transcription factor [Mesorhizobium sp. M4A.F.Ca.ET.020.02.1.1]|uniref:response regulator n=1 Tax=Mesorhizobium sp. M4A.F.Ca.ET.020.02.1.1 TaxID=2496652 RepID=UPI000FD45CF7|nr:response regulator transcription factor [Mesorhizobium sp. M4A.F.Ca.ET.020.02.1.1]RVD32936.1 response regulator transcription factor [Mesorhizobium sp. M4A.F.Ca.ET.020.02.1.1]